MSRTAYATNEIEDQMTDVTTETVGPDTEAEGWGEDASATYPEYPGNPHNHRFTVSMNGQGPMVVVRGNTAEEVNAGFQELEVAATGAVMGNAWAAIKAAAMLANGVGPVTPVPAPQGAPAPMPLPQAPQAQYPVGPPALPQGPAPAQWQNAGAPQGGYGGGQGGGARDNTPEFRQNGWLALTVPFPQGKKQFDDICRQYQLKKGRPAEGGTFSFNGANKTWYVSRDVAGCFPMFNPVPA
jgi:hypothetical protein